jgi:molecular chaperone HtpG
MMDGYFDSHYLNQLEQKFEKSRFVRVDSEVAEKLIPKDEKLDLKLTATQKEELTTVFSSQMPQMAKSHFIVSFEALGENDSPVMITQQEFMRRMKEMSANGGGMGFYGELPDSYNLVLNGNHVLVNRIAADVEELMGEKLTKIRSRISSLESKRTELEAAKKDKKDEEIPQAEKEELEDLTKKISEQKDKMEKLLKEFALGNKLVSQLIDLALLSNNMLKGEALNKFVKRSIELI